MSLSVPLALVLGAACGPEKPVAPTLTPKTPTPITEPTSMPTAETLLTAVSPIKSTNAPTVGATVLENRATIEKAAREEEIKTIRDRLKGHNLVPPLQRSVDSLLSTLPALSQPEYRSVIERKTQSDGRIVDIIHFNKYDGSQIKTFFLSSLPLNPNDGNSISQHLAVEEDFAPSADIDFRGVELVLRQRLYETFDNMKNPHTEFMVPEGYPPRVDAYTNHGADPQVPGTFSTSAKIEAGTVILEQFYYTQADPKETPTPITAETLEKQTDGEFVSGFLKKYFNPDADPLLKKLTDPKYLGSDSVLTKFVGIERPSGSGSYVYEGLPLGNFDSTPHHVRYVMDGMLVIYGGNSTTVIFEIDENGKIAQGRQLMAENRSGQDDTAIMEESALATANSLTRLVKHKPKGWEITGWPSDGDLKERGRESDIDLLTDGTKIQYKVLTTVKEELPFVRISIHRPYSSQNTP